MLNLDFPTIVIGTLEEVTFDFLKSNQTTSLIGFIIQLINFCFYFFLVRVRCADMTNIVDTLVYIQIIFFYPSKLILQLTGTDPITS